MRNKSKKIANIVLGRYNLLKQFATKGKVDVKFNSTNPRAGSDHTHALLPGVC